MTKTYKKGITEEELLGLLKRPVKSSTPTQIRDTLVCEMTLTGVDFTNTDLTNSTFQRCTFVNCSFVRAFLIDSMFVDCIFKNTVIVQCNATSSYFRGCKFTECTVTNCTFTHSTLLGCVLTNTLFVKNSLEETRLLDVDLTEAAGASKNSFSLQYPYRVRLRDLELGRVSYFYAVLLQSSGIPVPPPIKALANAFSKTQEQGVFPFML